jgi:ABC-2 type transport system permease protein
MSDLLTVLRKELKELLSERHSRRGVLIQSTLSIGVLGVMMPTTATSMWRDGAPFAVLFFLFMPGMLAATVAADAFAGERERRTLETLLATPLSEGAILAGKVGAAALFGLTVAAIALAVAVATLNLQGHAAPFVPSPILIAGALGGALASTVLVGTLAVIASLFIPVARAAQQTVAVGSMVLGGMVAGIWHALGVPLTWRALFKTESLLLVLGLCGLALARALFRRERFFEKA